MGCRSRYDTDIFALICDLDLYLQFRASCGHERPIRMQKKVSWFKRLRQTDMTDLITFPANTVVSQLDVFQLIVPCGAWRIHFPVSSFSGSDKPSIFSKAVNYYASHVKP